MVDIGLRRRFSGMLRRTPALFSVVYAVYHLFQPKYSVGVVGVVLNEHGQVLLVEHVFHPRHPWGLPGGWMDRNEQPRHAVVRELKEELDLDVEVSRLLLAEVSFRNHMDFAFLCRTSGEIGSLSGELLSYDWFDPTQLPHLVPFHYLAISQALQLVDEFTE
jgi:8-oxo-dGTP diphosphatase